MKILLSLIILPLFVEAGRHKKYNRHVLASTKSNIDNSTVGLNLSRPFNVVHDHVTTASWIKAGHLKNLRELKHIEKRRKSFVEKLKAKSHKGKQKQNYAAKDFIEKPSELGDMSHLSELLGISGAFVPSRERQVIHDEVTPFDDMVDSRSHENREYFHHPKESSPIMVSVDYRMQPRGNSGLKTKQYISSGSKTEPMEFIQHSSRHQLRPVDYDHYPAEFILPKEESLKSPKMGASLPNSIENKPDINSLRKAMYEEGKPKQLIPSVNPSFLPFYNTRLPSKKWQAEPAESGKPEKKASLNMMRDHYTTALEHTLGFSPDIVGGADRMKYFGEVRGRSREPMNHEIIHRIQLDPSWDKLEQKYLEQDGRKPSYTVPMNKLEKAMMPPPGVPVGTPYFPLHRYQFGSGFNTMHFHNHQQSMYPAPESSHPIETSGRNEQREVGQFVPPVDYNIGGAIVQASGSPWEGMHPDELLPIADANSPLPSNLEGLPVTNDRGGDGETAPSGGESAGTLSGSRVTASSAAPVKGEKGSILSSTKAVSNIQKAAATVADTKLNSGKEAAESASTTEEGDAFKIEVTPKAGRVKAVEVKTVTVPLSIKPKKMSKLRKEQNTPDNEKFDVDTNSANNIGLTHNERSRQRQDEKVNTDLAKQLKGKDKNELTRKFVGFLSDVAKHLNVDKLAIAEALVKDVEKNQVGNSKQNPSADSVTGERRQELSVKLTDGDYQHDQQQYGNFKNVEEASVKQFANLKPVRQESTKTHPVEEAFAKLQHIKEQLSKLQLGKAHSTKLQSPESKSILNNVNLNLNESIKKQNLMKSGLMSELIQNVNRPILIKYLWKNPVHVVKEQ